MTPVHSYIFGGGMIVNKEFIKNLNSAIATKPQTTASALERREDSALNAAHRFQKTLSYAQNAVANRNSIPFTHFKGDSL
jgi:hypothetical protein